MSRILVCGGGGFIGGHLTQSLMKNNLLVCADIKPMELWFQQSDKNKNLQLSISEIDLLRQQLTSCWIAPAGAVIKKGMFVKLDCLILSSIL